MVESELGLDQPNSPFLMLRASHSLIEAKPNWMRQLCQDISKKN